jgi:DNA-binding NarL/FixJ family response regulator
MHSSTQYSMLEDRSKPIRVVLADDHKLMREGLRALLRSLDSVEVVAEAADGREALIAVKEHRPDVLVTDISMKGLNGLEATAHVTKSFPQVRVIILSIHSHEEYIWQALRAGAVGYVLKDSDSNELELAITSVARGEMYLTPAVSKRVIENYLRRPASYAESSDSLTSRHREILQLIAEGNTTKKIAAILNLSAKTVETHRTQLMERLDIHEVAGLVRYAIRHHLVDSEC